MTRDISVTLGSFVVYVSGTVNGTSYTFALKGSDGSGTAWTSAVNRANDDTYHISITAIDNVGNTYTVTTTIYYGMQNLITDRTEADYLHWRELRDKGYAAMTEAERAEWDTAQMKGAYNPPYDMNRVGAAVEYLAKRFREYGYTVNTSAKQDWMTGDIPRESDMERYLQSIRNIRDKIAVTKDTPAAPGSAQKLNYAEANNIEQILLDVDGLITKMALSWNYTGELYAGEV